MTDKESIESDSRFQAIEQEFNERFERMQNPLNAAIRDAVFRAPFHLGQEAVNQFVTETVREKFPDYKPPATTESV